MNKFVQLGLFVFLFNTLCEATPRGTRGRGGNIPAATEEAATTTTATTTAAATTTSGTSSDYAAAAKALIDAGTCERVSSGTNCGTDGESYYEEFEYNGYRVVVSSGIPDHEAETGQTRANENTRCERWRYMAVPLSPSKGDSPEEIGMGTVGLAVTGGGFFNAQSSEDGDVALANEGTSLDSVLVTVN